MLLTLYKSRKEPWKCILVRTCKWRKAFYFRFTRTPKNVWMRRPRFMCYMSLGLFYFARNNDEVLIGVGVPRRFVAVEFCH